MGRWHAPPRMASTHRLRCLARLDLEKRKTTTLIYHTSRIYGHHQGWRQPPRRRAASLGGSDL
eukprot:2539049-Prymnesium_polylepis.1